MRSSLVLHLLCASLTSPIAAQSGIADFERDFGRGWTVWNGAFDVPYRVFGPGADVFPGGVHTLAQAQVAAMRVVRRHGDWLGVAPEDLRLHHSGEGRNILVVQYRQHHDGVPVARGLVSFVFNKGDGRMSMLGSTAVPELELETTAKLGVQDALRRYRAMTRVATASDNLLARPHLEIVSRDAGGFRLAWRVSAASDDGMQAWTLWIDAQDGRVLRRQSEIFDCCASARADLIGNVRGMVSPLKGGLSTNNPEQALPIAGIRVSVPGIGTTFTDANGDFRLPNAGNTPVNVTVSLASGQWWNPLTDLGNTSILSLTQSVTPGIRKSFLFNASPSQFTTAQANGAKYTMDTHDMIKRIVPTMTAIDRPVAVRVNDSRSCNAFFSSQGGGRITFFRENNSCNNSASAGIIAHEYGHFVDWRNGGIGRTPRTPSEGLADVHGIYLQRDPQVGYMSKRGGGRNGNNSLTHPLTGSTQAVHTFGQPFMGFSWDLLVAARSLYGTTVGTAIAERAMFESIVGNGRDMLDSVLQVYLADDDDSSLANGTPHIDALARAATKRHFLRPVFRNLVIRHTPLPDLANARLGLQVHALIDAHVGRAASAKVMLDTGSGFQSVPMTNRGGAWVAMLPPVSGVRVFRYYIEASSDRGNTARLPAEVGDAFVVALGKKTTVFTDDFESTTSNWTASNSGYPGWVRRRPVGRNYDPAAAASGQWAWSVDRSATDERFGTTSATVTLTSRPLNLTGRTGMRLRFKRWLTTDAQSTGRVRVNGNVVQSAGRTDDQAWRTFDIDVSAHADNRSNVVIQFELQHSGRDGVGGYTLDDVELYALTAGCATPVAYGEGLAGTSGVPTLTTTGGLPAVGNAGFAYRGSNMAPRAPAVCVLGTATAAYPVLGGVLVVAPEFLPTAVTSATGDLTWPLPIPRDASLVGVALFAQFAVADARAPRGVALTNGVAFAICP